MCRRFAWSFDAINAYVVEAATRRDRHVIIDRLLVGAPAARKCIALLFGHTGSVTCCTAFAGLATDEFESARGRSKRDQVLATGQRSRSPITLCVLRAPIASAARAALAS
jgi:hypothetical protein